MTFLILRGVSKRYGKTLAVADLDIQIPQGEQSAVVGPSGSGKTTLLRLIAGFEIPDAGEITLRNQLMTNSSFFMPAHRRNVGIVAQDGALFPHLSVGDNIGFGLARTDAGREKIISDLMDLVDLPLAMLGRRPDQLSGGQQQRVALARALARKPNLMLLDEPFSALDAGLRQDIRKSVSAILKAEGVTTILVTHDRDEAMSFADRIFVLREGKLAQSGTPRELYLRPRDLNTAEFLGDAIVVDANIRDGFAYCIFGRLKVTELTAGNRAIMIRPEQLSLSAASDENVHECHAVVESSIFSGGHHALALVLANGRPLRLLSTAWNPPEIGSRVAITVSGTVHVF